MPKPLSEQFTTELQFFPCERCKGFGYEIGTAKEHIRCTACKDNPSIYAVRQDRILHWGLRVSREGIAQRRARRFFNLSLNILLLVFGVAGVGALVVAGYQYIATADLFDLFDKPRIMMAVFWASILTDSFLFYRLDQERASKRSLNQTKKEAQKEPKHPFKMPVAPSYTKFDEMPRDLHTDIAAYYTTDAIKGVDDAYVVAKRLGHHVITPLHLFAAIMEQRATKLIVARLGLSREDLLLKIGKAMAVEGMDAGRGIDLGLEANRIMFYAYEEAVQKGREYVDVMELMVAMIHHDPWLNEIFYDLEVEDRTVLNVVEWIHIQRDLRKRYIRFRSKAKRKPKGIMDRAMTAVESKLVSQLTTDFTAVARVGGFFPLIGRKTEMDQVLRIMRRSTGNILMVGPPGVGKTTMFEGFADLLAAEDVPPELQDKRLVMLDPGSLIGDAKGIGTVEGRINRVIQEVSRAGNIVLGIEDVHHLLNMRSTGGSEDVASILMNALSQGRLRVIATATTQEYQEIISMRGTFLRRFQVVNMEEMSRDDAILVLEARAGSIEYKHKVFFSYAAIAAAVDMSVQYIQDRYLPAKALDIIEEAASLVEMERGAGTAIQKEDIARIISEKTNVQVTAITSDERNKLLNLEQVMHQRIVGQNEAVQAIASALRRAREGLRDQHRPIANLLFLGPTGVGKTETAKTVAEVYFGNESNMIRLDMSEYQDPFSLNKLIGGKGEQGYLTEAVRQKPFSIVLLDEMEKAHPDVLNVFLQVMDDGRITDGTGRTVDMSNTMVIATSNAATQQIQNAFAAGMSAVDLERSLMQDVLPRLFRPEFINRFDNVVLFTPLSMEEVVEVARRMIIRIADNLLEQKGIVMEATPDAIVELAQRGYDPQYGARPLRRVVQDTVDDALAKLLLSERIGRRDTVVLLPGGQMQIKKAMEL